MRYRNITCYGRHISKYRTSTEMTVLAARKEFDAALEKLAMGPELLAQQGFTMKAPSATTLKINGPRDACFDWR